MFLTIFLNLVLVFSLLFAKLTIGEEPQGIAAQTFSSTIPELLVRGFIQRRQEKVCSIPGGPICDALTCCRPGYQCCTAGCCPLDSSCFLPGRCCPNTWEKCSGGITCCPPSYTCCGSTCCGSGEFCERGHCIDNTLKDRVAKFELDLKENLELLKNMCEGMKRGNGGVPRNTEVLTYRGKAKKFPRGKVRKAAGCVSKYCRKLINAGASASLNSCDEYPPAMSLEGGDFRDAAERIIACIPDVQNSRQGNRFSNMVQAFEKANGIELQQGDKFVVSVECDKVASLGGAELPEPVIRRQTIEPMQGQAAVDSEIKGFEIPDSFVLIPLGDLDPGSYTIEVQGVEGSTTAGFVYDRDGDEMFATIATGVSGGQSQQMTFQFPDPMFGISVALNTLNNNTKVSWSLRGDPTLTRTPSPSTSVGGGSNGPPRSSASSIHWKREIQVAIVSSIVFFMLI